VIEDLFLIGSRLIFRSSTSSSSLSFLADKFSPIGLTDSNGFLPDGFDYVESVDGWMKLRLNLVTCFRVANLHLTDCSRWLVLLGLSLVR
jgi:hypothetical protein